MFIHGTESDTSEPTCKRCSESFHSLTHYTERNVLPIELHVDKEAVRHFVCIIEPLRCLF